MKTFENETELEAYVAQRIQATIDALPNEVTQHSRSDGSVVVTMSFEVFSVYRRAVTTTEDLSPDQIENIWVGTNGHDER